MTPLKARAAMYAYQRPRSCGVCQADSGSHGLWTEEGDQKSPALSDGAREWKWLDGDAGTKKRDMKITLGCGRVNKIPSELMVCQNVYLEKHEENLIVPWENLGNSRHDVIPLFS